MTLKSKLREAMRHFNYDVYYDEVMEDLEREYGSEVENLSVDQIVEFVDSNDYAITGML